MNKYFDSLLTILGTKKKQEKEDFRYTNQGIFREKVEAYVFFGNEFVMAGDLTHHGEDAFMRLIKVYCKAAKNLLDAWFTLFHIWHITKPYLIWHITKPYLSDISPNHIYY